MKNLPARVNVWINGQKLDVQEVEMKFLVDDVGLLTEMKLAVCEHCGWNAMAPSDLAVIRHRRKGAPGECERSARYATASEAAIYDHQEEDNGKIYRTDPTQPPADLHEPRGAGSDKEHLLPRKRRRGLGFEEY